MAHMITATQIRAQFGRVCRNPRVSYLHWKVKSFRRIHRRVLVACTVSRIVWACKYDPQCLM